MLDKTFLEKVFAISKAVRKAVSEGLGAEQLVNYSISSGIIAKNDYKTQLFLKQFAEKKGQDVVEDYVKFSLANTPKDSILKSAALILDTVNGIKHKYEEYFTNSSKRLSDKNTYYSERSFEIEKFAALGDLDLDKARAFFYKKVDELLDKSGNDAVDRISEEKISAYKAEIELGLSQKESLLILSSLKSSLEKALNFAKAMPEEYGNVLQNLIAIQKDVKQLTSDEIIDKLIELSWLYQDKAYFNLLGGVKNIPSILNTYHDTLYEGINTQLSDEKYVELMIVRGLLLEGSSSYEADKHTSLQLLHKCQNSDLTSEHIDKLFERHVKDILSPLQQQGLLQKAFVEIVDVAVRSLGEFVSDASQHIETINPLLTRVDEKIEHYSKSRDIDVQGDIEVCQNLCKTAFETIYTSVDAQPAIANCQNAKVGMLKSKLNAVKSIYDTLIKQTTDELERGEEESSYLHHTYSKLHDLIVVSKNDDEATYNAVQDGLIQLIKFTNYLHARSLLEVESSYEAVCNNDVCERLNLEQYGVSDTSRHSDNDLPLVEEVGANLEVEAV
jgi:hypothetical protein